MDSGRRLLSLKLHLEGTWRLGDVCAFMPGDEDQVVSESEDRNLGLWLLFCREPA